MGVFGELQGRGKAFWDVGVSGLNGVGEFARSTGGQRTAGLGQTLPDAKLLPGVTGSDIIDAGRVVIEGMVQRRFEHLQPRAPRALTRGRRERRRTSAGRQSLRGHF